MKTNIIITLSILLSLCFNLSFSQIRNGAVTYTSTSKLSETIKKVKTKSENKDAKQFINKMSQRVNQNLKDIEFNLLFSNNESLFQAIEKMSKDDIDEFAILTVGGNGSFYVNSTTNEKLHQMEAFGKQFLIKDNIAKIRWNLSNDTKKVLQYDCRKATTIKIVENEKGLFRKEVIAWYAPEIPISFGPIGYGGLPGLILELDIENESNFSVKKIKINSKKEINIKKPKKGKLVSNEGFNNIAKKLSNWSKMR